MRNISVARQWSEGIFDILSVTTDIFHIVCALYIGVHGAGTTSADVPGGSPLRASSADLNISL
jgi:hypothetical protein